MTPDWTSVTQDIFGIIKGSGLKLKMFDEDMQPTFDVEKARQFYATDTDPADPDIKSFSMVISLHDDNTNSHCDIQTPKLKNPKDFNKILSLRNYIQKNVGDRQGLSVNWYQFDHDITPREEPSLAESADISKPWGTTKSSFQKVGNCRLIIRHTDTINEEVPGSRWRKIHRVFVETSQGERFVFPVPHMRGARALARHISHGGSSHDDIGQHIKSLSEDFHNLKIAGRKLRMPAQTDANLTTVLSELHQRMHEINHELKTWCGPRGYDKMAKTYTADQPAANNDLPLWLLNTVEECCCDQKSVVQKYYIGNHSIEPELNEFQDWLVQEQQHDELDDDQTPGDDQSAKDQARSSYQDYQQQDDDPQQALDQTLKFLIGNNDWWRSQWESDPDQAQQDLRDLVWDESPADPELTRMKKLAGM